MTGKIIKGIAGFYYVDIPDEGTFECKAKGIFRKNKIKPLVGDNVDIEVLDYREKTGNIIKIKKRKNELIRPAVANIDQTIIVFSVSVPKPNILLLDKFLVTNEKKGISSIICFNKTDSAGDKEINELCDIYRNTGYKVFRTSTVNMEGIDELKKNLYNKTSAFAGPSGVGKSSILNLLQNKVISETGEISKKTSNGKHTTRYSQLILFDNNSYIVDTPGFSSFELYKFNKDELKNYFIEFRKYEDNCKFQNCKHINEPECGVKMALNDKKISVSRYNNYCNIYNEIADNRRI